MVTVAIAALALLGYTYVGYPLLVAALAGLRRPRRSADPPPWKPRVSVCIAARDAAAWLPAKLDSLRRQDYPAELVEILVYSDGSIDDTERIVSAEEARDPRVHLLRSARRRGKPHALNRLREAAAGEVLVLTDARQTLDPDAVSALVAALADPSVGCASGLLCVRGAAGAGAYWRYEAWIRRSESRFRGLVGVTGALYATRARDLEPLPTDIVLDDVWVPMRQRLRGRRIVLCEAARAHDAAFADGAEFSRKVRTLAGNYQLFARMPRLLLPLVNPSWFELVSHKVLRLLCPWALVALAAATAALVLAPPAEAGAAVRWGAWLLAAGQVALYGAAALGGRAAHVGAVARTFVVMNAAAVVGLWRFATGGQRIAW
jgi:poly-beta-1,6-N-acetyl-D-glucosamine synthase